MTKVCDSDASIGTEDDALIENINPQKTDNQDASIFEVGNYVIFLYNGPFFVRKIECVSEEESMQKSLKNWKLFDKEDINLYPFSDIKQKINTKRYLYYVDILNFYLALMCGTLMTTQLQFNRGQISCDKIRL